MHIASPSFREELRTTTNLALPLALAHVGQQTMGLVDTAMLGHFSSLALAGSGIANGLIFAATCLGIGIIMGLDTLIPQAVGSGKLAQAHKLLRSGLRLCFIVGIPITIAAALLPLLLEPIGIDARVCDEASLYLWCRLPALIPMLLFTAYRSYLQSINLTFAIVFSTIVANVINVIADYFLIFGTSSTLLGITIPPLGVVGAAIATCLVSILSVMIVARAAKPKEPFPEIKERNYERTIFRLGIPVGLQLFAEVGIFTITALLAGIIGATAAAAHQVAITLASLTFSVVLGIGAATSVRVGVSVGQGSHKRARRASMAGLSLGLLVMSLTATLFLVAPEILASLFSDDIDIQNIAVQLLQIAAFFQLSDGLQAITAGTLRGAGDTRTPLWANLFGHYVVGLSLAYILAFPLSEGAPGLWWGLSAGLSSVGIFLLVKVLRLTSSPIPAIFSSENR